MGTSDQSTDQMTLSLVLLRFPAFSCVFLRFPVNSCHPLQIKRAISALWYAKLGHPIQCRAAKKGFSFMRLVQVSSQTTPNRVLTQIDSSLGQATMMIASGLFPNRAPVVVNRARGAVGSCQGINAKKPKTVLEENLILGIIHDEPGGLLNP